MILVRILFVVFLLGVATWGVMACVNNPAALKSMIIDGMPIVVPHGGTSTQLPGRLVGGLIIGITALSALGVMWMSIEICSKLSDQKAEPDSGGKH